MPHEDEAGVFYSFETLFKQLSDKLDSTMGAITSKLDDLQSRIDSKASKEQLDAAERRWHAMFEQLGGRLKSAEDAIVDIRVADAGPRAASKIQLVLFVAIIAGVFSIISALIYVVATGGHP